MNNQALQKKLATNQLLIVARSIALKNRSDPFMFARVLTHHLNGVKDIMEYKEENRVE